MRKCNQCKNEKPLDAFHFKNKQTGVRHYTCKECSKENSASWAVRNKSRLEERRKAYNKKAREINTALICEYLKDKKCADCGIVDIRLLDFDHVHGEKKCSISNMIRKSYLWQTILDEIEKCEIVCANCHRLRTAKQFG